MISPTLNENYQVFTDDFFSPFKDKQINYELQLTNSISKTFKFPTFFKGTENGLGIFLCSYEKLKKHMPNQNLDPVRMPGGRAVFAISCFKYMHIQEMQAYNEISFTVPVVTKGHLNIPFLTMAAKNLSNIGYYVFSMPVNSEENNIRGNKIWGLPKFNTRIDISTNTDKMHTVLYDGEQPYIELTYPTHGHEKNFREDINVYSFLNTQFLKARVVYTGKYKVNRHLGVALSKSASANSEFIKINDTPRGKILKDLEIDSMPFETRYSNNVLSALHLPEAFEQ